jgi:hypothetical protein
VRPTFFPFRWMPGDRHKTFDTRFRLARPWYFHLARGGASNEKAHQYFGNHESAPHSHRCPSSDLLSTVCDSELLTTSRTIDAHDIFDGSCALDRGRSPRGESFCPSWNPGLVDCSDSRCNDPFAKVGTGIAVVFCTPASFSPSAIHKFPRMT